MKDLVIEHSKIFFVYVVTSFLLGPSVVLMDERNNWALRILGVLIALVAVNVFHYGNKKIEGNQRIEIPQKGKVKTEN